MTVGLNYFDVPPDGQRFLVARPLVNRDMEALTVVTSWTEGLK
jgi:hypothetical protein